MNGRILECFSGYVNAYDRDRPRSGLIFAIGLALTGFHRRPRLTVDFPASDGLALFVRLLTLDQRQRGLEPPVLEIELQRHEREPLFPRETHELVDLVLVHQQLPLTPFLVGRITGVA